MTALALYLVTLAADVYSTILCVNEGHGESSPLTRLFLWGRGTGAALWAVGRIGIGAWLYAAHQPGPLWILTAYAALATANNVRVLRRGK